jgi:3-hydroxyisobutyrate dehydrogenase-like beta-hydroxyacid dehydrogenase
MTQIALIGAGGKMGVRLATNLRSSRFTVDHVEKTSAGRERLVAETGQNCVELKEAVARADVVLLAVPDALIGKVAHEIVGDVRPGAAIIMLDAPA